MLTIEYDDKMPDDKQNTTSEYFRINIKWKRGRAGTIPGWWLPELSRTED
jgi:hypothetical protein